MGEHTSVILYFIGVNLVSFVLMLVDKRKAVKQQYRIPERTLWALAVLGGALGIYLGMQKFRHKTKHTSFVVGMPLLLLVNIASLVYIFFFMS